MIPVTKSFVPPIEEYTAIVNRAFATGWLTNRGELVLELEEKLKKFLQTNDILITNNGTISLQIALKLFGKGGEIITTPFSYIATSSSIVWENCTPVYVDIDSEYLTIDENKIEAAITPKTTCILATHVYGNPCNTEAIETIAKKHNLKVIYDAAHCFGVNYKGKSLFEYGDISTCSFHATKLFHTGEGGAIFCNDETIKHQVYYSHNFGHNGSLEFHGLGINAKISELNAAMGLTVLPYMDRIISNRKDICEKYDNTLNFSKISKVKIREGTEWNYIYYPIIFETEEILLKAEKLLNDNNIHPRRYFYPSLNTVGFTGNQEMEISENISSRIMCLPLFYNLDIEDQKTVCNLINSVC